MRDARAPTWLADFQARFGAVIRTPLDRTTGKLRTTPTKYDPNIQRVATAGSLVSDGHRRSGVERLAVYNRQYWLRLFGVIGGAFPLTARLLGYWRFNAIAAAFLEQSPPRHWNIDHVPEGFSAFLTRETREKEIDVGPRRPRLPRRALNEAAEIDEAWRLVHHASPRPGWRLTAELATTLATSRLRPSEGVRLVKESWPLIDLRGQLVTDVGEESVPLPARLTSPRSWALVRRPAGVGLLPLDATEARLFSLLRSHAVGEALARLEAASSEAERPLLPAKARAWLARSVELDFWAGLDAVSVEADQ